MLTEAIIHKVGRIDQIVRDFFDCNTSVQEIPAKDLMDLFIRKRVFNKDYSRRGLPIRKLLRQLDAENKLSLIKYSKVVRRYANRSWCFSKT